MARVVGAKPTPAEPRATPANAPKTAAPTIAAINFFLKRNTRTGPPPLISIACRRVSHTPCNVRRKDSSKPLVVLGMLDSAGGRASSQSSYPRPADRESGAHLVPQRVRVLGKSSIITSSKTHVPQTLALVREALALIFRLTK